MFFTRAGVQNSYNSKVKIGNWSEEQELEQLKMKEFLYRKDNGDLLVHKIQNHLSSSLSEVPLSYSPDGFIRFGYSIMIYSIETEGVLSTDPADKAMSSNKAFPVTTSTLTHAHVARNTFIIEPYGTSSRVGDVLKYGDSFRLRINPKLSQTPMYLHSQPVSSLCSSKVSRYQEVSFIPSTIASSSRSSLLNNTTNNNTSAPNGFGSGSFDTVWRCVSRDISTRFENMSKPVPANAEIVILHAATSSALSSSLLPYYNDYGLEYEICAHTHINIGKTQGLHAERTGKITTDIPVRREHRPNAWAILTSATESDNNNNSNNGNNKNNSATERGVELLENIREILVKGGKEAMHNLSRSFRLLDPTGSEIVNKEQFGQVLKNNNIQLESSRDLDILCSLFDSHGVGEIDFVNFFTQIRGGEPNPRRLQLIHRVFDTLQVNGVALLKDLALVYDPSGNALVRAGRETNEMARNKLLAAFQGYNGGNGTITKSDFVDYYSTVSAFTETDEYFVTLLTNEWRIKE